MFKLASGSITAVALGPEVANVFAAAAVVICAVVVGPRAVLIFVAGSS